MKKVVLTIVVCMFGALLHAQNITVKGIVKDGSGNAVYGATVHLKGTSTGVTTGADGSYTITVPANSNLEISFLGYKPQEITASKTVHDIVLEEDAFTLEAATVTTALGMKRDTRALGYAISTVKGSDMTVAGNTVNPLTTLYGKAAGVGVQSTIGGPTGGVNIKIRGAAGLETSSKTRPLFVVDGVPIYDKDSDMSSRGYDPLNSFDYGSGINDVNPEDIESMEILKGAKASVLYGSEGANGVVLITTKRGSHTRGLGVQLSYQHTVEKPFSYIDWQNEYGTGSSVYSISETTEGKRKIVSNRFSFGPKFDGSPMLFYDGSTQPYQAYPDNFDNLFQTGSSDNMSVAISGGNEKSNMRVSYSNYKYNGIMDNFWQKRNTLSFSGKMNVSDFASFEIVTNLYNVETHNRLPNIESVVAWGIHRDYDYQKLKAIYKDQDGYFNQTLLEDGGLPNSSATLVNIWWHQNENSNTDKKIHNITSVRANLKFFPWLYLIAQGGVDYSNTDYTVEEPVRQVKPTTSGGKYAFKRDNSYIQNYEAYLNFEKAFMEDRLKVHAFAGPSYRRNKDNTIGVSTYGGLNYEGWYSLNNGKSWPGQSNAGNVRSHSRGSDLTYGLSGTATFSWKDTYYLEFQARNEWCSTLPPSNNSYFYPGVSFTWNFTDVFQIPYVNYGKVWASWADVGRPASRYFALKSYDIGYLPELPDVVSVQGPGDLFAGALKPERKREYDAGFSLRMFPQNRLELSFSYYTNNVYDQIMSVPLSNTTGAGNIRINAGNVRNWGWELFVKAAPIIGHNYRWEVTFTSANQYSKVIKLYPGITRKPLGGSGFTVVAEEGERYGEILMYDYSRDPNGNRIVESSGLYALDRSAMKPINKNINPDFFGGLLTDFFWKGFNIHIGLDYRFGSSIFSYSNYYLTGLGSTKNTLAYRDEEHGGIAYYIGKDANDRDVTVKWEHNQPAPSGSVDGRVYHNGMILPGVKADGNGGYAKNDIIVNSTAYYQSFISDMGDAFQPDALHKNDYIKLREIALGYTLPKAWSEKVKMQKVTFSLMARNLFYLYKSLPNVDAESAVGTSGQNSYMERSFYPTIRTFGFGVNLSF